MQTSLPRTRTPGEVACALTHFFRVRRKQPEVRGRCRGLLHVDHENLNWRWRTVPLIALLLLPVVYRCCPTCIGLVSWCYARIFANECLACVSERNGGAGAGSALGAEYDGRRAARAVLGEELRSGVPIFERRDDRPLRRARRLSGPWQNQRRFFSRERMYAI